MRTMMAESLEFEDEAFDSIVSVHAIEHIPPLSDALAEAERVLKPGGRALFIYPVEPIMGTLCDSHFCDSPRDTFQSP